MDSNAFASQRMDRPQLRASTDLGKCSDFEGCGQGTHVGTSNTYHVAVLVHAYEPLAHSSLTDFSRIS